MESGLYLSKKDIFIKKGTYFVITENNTGILADNTEFPAEILNQYADSIQRIEINYNRDLANYCNIMADTYCNICEYTKECYKFKDYIYKTVCPATLLINKSNNEVFLASKI